MLETGTVVKIKKNIAFVKIAKSSRCAGCRNCAFGADDTAILPSVIQSPCAVGDTVVLQMPLASFAGASLILFLVPLVLMLVGLLLGMTLGTLAMLLLGIGFLAIGIAFSVLVDGSLRQNPKYSPVVVDRIL